jgi:hypothetical protein
MLRHRWGQPPDQLDLVGIKSHEVEHSRTELLDKPDRGQLKGG